MLIYVSTQEKVKRRITPIEYVLVHSDENRDPENEKCIARNYLVIIIHTKRLISALLLITACPKQCQYNKNRTMTCYPLSLILVGNLLIVLTACIFIPIVSDVKDCSKPSTTCEVGKTCTETFGGHDCTCAKTSMYGENCTKGK